MVLRVKLVSFHVFHVKHTGLTLLCCRLILVDTLALMYRIHYGYGSKARLTAPDGQDTTIVYGMLDVIIRLLEIKPPPTHFAMVVDMAAKTWRCAA